MVGHRIAVTVLALLLLDVSASNAQAPQEVLERYFQIAVPEKGLMGPTRAERVRCLRGLLDTPAASVPAIAAALSSSSRVVHRVELLETLGRIETRSSADVLLQYLDDENPAVRAKAIQGLRLLARRIDRKGIEAPRDPQFPPPVEGLVPYLVTAARTEVGNNRKTALFALADTRDPRGQAELRHTLRDSVASVRFAAAYLLSEFGDDSGLPELRRKLADLAAQSDRGMFVRYAAMQQLFAAFERLTGESMGQIPLPPFLSSGSPEQVEQLKNEYETQLNRWAEWWSQEVEGN
jgi:hypothetical protein